MSSSTINNTSTGQDAAAGGRSLFPLIVAYYGLSAIFLFWKPDSFAKDIIVAPLYFAVPAGIGLFLLSLNGTHRRLQDWLSRPQIALGGAFIGFVAISVLHQELERTDLLRASFPWLFPALTTLSLYGCYRVRRWLVLDSVAVKRGTKTLLLLLPFAAFAYWFQYLHFSSFPLRDIFQELHFMKGAHELSRTQILNPFITTSYLPFITVLLGQLHHFYGLDLLRANWILPAYAYLFHLGCYIVFFSSILRDRDALRLALVLATLLAPMFYVENMIMLESMLLVLFSILVRVNGAAMPGRFGTILVGLVALFVAYYYYFNYVLVAPPHVPGLPPASYTGMWVLAAVVFAVAVFQDSARVVASVFLALLAVSAFLMHRGILLFLPMVLLAWTVHHLVTNTKMVAHEPGKRIALTTGVLAGSALVFLAALALWVLSRYGSHEAVSNEWSTWIAERLLRTTKIEFGGTGFGHSLVEYLRLSPPLLVLATLTLLVGFLISYGRRLFSVARQNGPTAGQTGAYPYLNEIVYFVLVISALTALVLSLVPYAYRGAFFPAVFGIALFATLMSGYVAYAKKNGPSRERTVWVSLALLGYMLVSVVYLYSPSRSFLGDTNTYLSAVRPLLMAMVAGGFLLWGLSVVYRRNKAAVNALLVLAALAVSFDAVAFRTLFSEKAYGKDLPESGVISHYTPLEVELGRTLRSYPVKSILISDPYTSSILRGVSGLNSVYSFANINVVSDDAKYRNLFRYVASLGDGKFSKAKAQELFAVADSLRGAIHGEAMYLWNRMYDGSGNLVSVDDIYRNFVWVVDAKTFRWAAGEDGYYPDVSPLPADLVSSLRDYFDVEENLDGRLLVMRLKRQPVLADAVAEIRGLEGRGKLGGPQSPCACSCPPPRRTVDCPSSLQSILERILGPNVGNNTRR